MLEIAAEQGIDAVERDIWPMELHAADGAFVCGSGAGIVPIGSFDGRPVRFPDHPLIERIQDALPGARPARRITDRAVRRTRRSTLARHEVLALGAGALALLAPQAASAKSGGQPPTLAAA